MEESDCWGRVAVFGGGELSLVEGSSLKSSLHHLLDGLQNYMNFLICDKQSYL